MYLPFRNVNSFLTYYSPLMAGIPSNQLHYPPAVLGASSSGATTALNGEGPAQLRKLFIGGLNHETTDEQLREYYSQWGTVVDCIVIRDPATKQSRGFGFVTYSTIQMAESAMANRPHTINGKVVDPKRAIPREQMCQNNPPYFLDSELQTECKMLLCGIHWDFHTVDSIRQYFEKYGSIEQVEILGHPRGFGFIVFEDKNTVDICLCSGKSHVINGKKIDIKEFTKETNPLNKRTNYTTKNESSHASLLTENTSDQIALNIEPIPVDTDNSAVNFNAS